MSAKNISKINSLNLFGLAKRFPKGFAPHRNVTSCKQLKKRSPSNEPDFSKFLSKSSATSLVKEESLKNSNPTAQKRSEYQLAADRVRKCNEILKEHYLQKRKMQESIISGALQQLPVLSKKLKDIMAQDLESSSKNQPKIDYIRRCHGLEAKRDITDYKPQVCGNVNRWHMKIPSRRPQELDESPLSDLDTSILTKRSRRPIKVVKPPEPQVTQKLTLNEKREQKKMLRKEKAKSKMMWQIGERYIPRLD